jgi:DNA mismatch repair ATPase MutS
MLFHRLEDHNNNLAKTPFYHHVIHVLFFFTVNTINGFSQLKRILLLLREHSEHFSCLLLQEIFELDSKFEEFCEIVDHFETLFDHNEALENYFIIPKPGTSSEFDVAIQQEKLLESQFTEYLTKIKKELKYAQIVYNVKSPSDPYTIEISNKFKDIPSYFQMVSSLKSVNRFTTPELQLLIDQQYLQKDAKFEILREITRDIFSKFDKKNSILLTAVKKFAEFDCLASLTKISNSEIYQTCPPNFISNVDHSPFIDLKSNVHPFLRVSNGSTIIPNDISIGKKNANSIIVSGANMGGKRFELNS